MNERQINELEKRINELETSNSNFVKQIQENNKILSEILACIKSHIEINKKE